MKQASAHKKPNLELAFAMIKNSSYKLTRPRKLIVQSIIKQDKPFSANSIERQLNGKKGCDLVTIYRTLPVLAEIGLIEKCDFSESETFYELACSNQSHHHHHVVCNSCQKVESVHFCVVENQQSLLQKLGYTNLKHRLEFTGLCPSCS